MYDINRTKGDLYVNHYLYKSRNEYNQIIVCEIYRDIHEHINFTFYITSKRKRGFQEGKITGKDGIKSLIWAKNCLLDFIKYAKHHYPKDIITIWATDKRRYKVYERSLIPLGFKHANDRYRHFYLKLDEYSIE